VPKKRGPKTDVLEALLKRVDGLEKRLHTEGKSDDLSDLDPSITQDSNSDSNPHVSPLQSRHPVDIAPNRSNATSHGHQLMSPVEPRCADISAECGAVTLLTIRQCTNANTIYRATVRHLLRQNSWQALLHLG
jgi:hypothetical protein